MSARTDTDGYTTLDLRRMDREEAETTLTVREFRRWESLQDRVERAEATRDEFDAAERETHEVLVATDASDLATEVNAFGNELLVYYGPEDSRLQEAVGDLFDTADVDPEGAEDLSADDFDDDVIEEAKSTMLDVLDVALIEWNGYEWSELTEHTRQDIRDRIAEPRPNGWGAAGLMDTLVTVIEAVEANRDERMERIQKFRDETRRGDR